MALIQCLVSTWLHFFIFNVYLFSCIGSQLLHTGPRTLGLSYGVWAKLPHSMWNLSSLTGGSPHPLHWEVES